MMPVLFRDGVGRGKAEAVVGEGFAGIGVRADYAADQALFNEHQPCWTHPRLLLVADLTGRHRFLSGYLLLNHQLDKIHLQIHLLLNYQILYAQTAMECFIWSAQISSTFHLMQ